HRGSPERMIENHADAAAVQMLAIQDQGVSQSRADLIVRKLNLIKRGKRRNQVCLRENALVAWPSGEDGQRRLPGLGTVNKSHRNFVAYREAVLRGQAGPQP